MRVLRISIQRVVVGLEGLMVVQYLKPVPGTLEVLAKCESGGEGQCGSTWVQGGNDLLEWNHHMGIRRHIEVGNRAREYIPIPD